MKYYKRVLSIAGSDPSGGAGIQADLKTFSACGCYGTTAITAVVDENTIGISGIHYIPASFVKRQICSVLDDIGVDAIKIGMLYSSRLVQIVKNTLVTYCKNRNIVLDPVMVATSGDSLLKEDTKERLKHQLIPIACIITPNIPEAEALLDTKISNLEDCIEAAKKLSFFSKKNNRVSVLLKSGHLQMDTLTDVFYYSEIDNFLYFPHSRVQTNNTHGTGCSLSSAIASFLAHGYRLDKAVEKAEFYIEKAILIASKYKIGKGNGPIHHFFSYWE